MVAVPDPHSPVSAKAIDTFLDKLELQRNGQGTSNLEAVLRSGQLEEKRFLPAFSEKLNALLAKDVLLHEQVTTDLIKACFTFLDSLDSKPRDLAYEARIWRALGVLGASAYRAGCDNLHVQIASTCLHYLEVTAERHDDSIVIPADCLIQPFQLLGLGVEDEECIAEESTEESVIFSEAGNARLSEMIAFGLRYLFRQYEDETGPGLAESLCPLIPHGDPEHIEEILRHAIGVLRRTDEDSGFEAANFQKTEDEDEMSLARINTLCRLYRSLAQIQDAGADKSEWQQLWQERGPFSFSAVYGLSHISIKAAVDMFFDGFFSDPSSFDALVVQQIVNYLIEFDADLVPGARSNGLPLVVRRLKRTTEGNRETFFHKLGELTDSSESVEDLDLLKRELKS